MGTATRARPLHDSDTFDHWDATQGTVRVPWIASRWKLIADDVVVKPISLLTGNLHDPLDWRVRRGVGGERAGRYFHLTPVEPAVDAVRQ